MKNNERKHFLYTHSLFKGLSFKEHECIFEIKNLLSCYLLNLNF